MEAFRSVSGAAAALMMDDINTDQVIPSVYLKDLHADMAQGLLAFMRRNPDGSSRPDFVLEKPQYRGAPILVTGANFGCGSSREHAVWALRAFGFRCVIGVSPAEFFRDNCLKNGVRPTAMRPSRSISKPARSVVPAATSAALTSRPSSVPPCSKVWTTSARPESTWPRSRPGRPVPCATSLFCRPPSHRSPRQRPDPRRPEQNNGDFQGI